MPTPTAPPLPLKKRVEEALKAMERERQRLNEIAQAHARLRAKLWGQK